MNAMNAAIRQLITETRSAPEYPGRTNIVALCGQLIAEVTGNKTSAETLGRVLRAALHASWNVGFDAVLAAAINHECRTEEPDDSDVEPLDYGAPRAEFIPEQLKATIAKLEAAETRLTQAQAEKRTLDAEVYALKADKSRTEQSMTESQKRWPAIAATIAIIDDTPAWFVESDASDHAVWIAKPKSERIAIKGDRDRLLTIKPNTESCYGKPTVEPMAEFVQRNARGWNETTRLAAFRTKEDADEYARTKNASTVDALRRAATTRAGLVALSCYLDAAKRQGVIHEPAPVDAVAARVQKLEAEAFSIKNAADNVERANKHHQEQAEKLKAALTKDAVFAISKQSMELAQYAPEVAESFIQMVTKAQEVAR